MAQVYPYLYRGELRTKQDKCRTAVPLDKPRIWLDFNELCDADEASGAPIYLFSQADIVNDSEGTDVALHEGKEVSVFDDDLDASHAPDPMLADGVVIENSLEQYPRVKWLIKLLKHGMRYKSGEEYVYWMSDLQ